MNVRRIAAKVSCCVSSRVAIRISCSGRRLPKSPHLDSNTLTTNSGLTQSNVRASTNIGASTNPSRSTAAGPGVGGCASCAAAAARFKWVCRPSCANSMRSRPTAVTKSDSCSADSNASPASRSSPNCSSRALASVAETASDQGERRAMPGRSPVQQIRIGPPAGAVRCLSTSSAMAGCSARPMRTAAGRDDDPASSARNRPSVRL
jgi:hypothetical protein